MQLTCCKIHVIYLLNNTCNLLAAKYMKSTSCEIHAIYLLYNTCNLLAVNTCSLIVAVKYMQVTCM